MHPFIDVLLTIAFFKYANTEYYGLDKSAHDLEWYIPRKKKNYVKLLNALIVSDEEYAIYEPISPYYLSLKNALKSIKKLKRRAASRS